VRRDRDSPTREQRRGGVEQALAAAARVDPERLVIRVGLGDARVAMAARLTFALATIGLITSPSCGDYFSASLVGCPRTERAVGVVALAMLHALADAEASGAEP
jgi:hypothetical protein